MVQIAIGLIRLQDWFGGDFAEVIDLVRIADDKGVDLVTLTDHLAFCENVRNYPHGRFNFSLETPFFEPMSVLSAIAAVTKRIRLSTSVLIGALRPALLLAKQVGTLDLLSHGRVELGLGAGWLKDEFDACNAPYEGRFDLLTEQVEAMRTLWREAPASFHGQHIHFDGLYCLPFPVQPRIPILFGVSASERNIERIAVHGDGWIPVERDPEVLTPAIKALREAFARRGRDPGSLIVRVMPEGTTSVAMEKIRQSGPLRLEETAARLPALLKAGVTQLEFHPSVWTNGADEFPEFMERLAALKSRFS